MSVLIDTSAFISIGDEDATYNQRAVATWARCIASGEELIAPSYTVVETVSLLQRRAGSAGVAKFAQTILPVISVLWVDSALHNAAMSAFLTAGGGRHAPSLVDCVSFEIVRQKRIDRVFAYDEHFADRGFEVIGQ